MDQLKLKSYRGNENETPMLPQQAGSPATAGEDPASQVIVLTSYLTNKSECSLPPMTRKKLPCQNVFFSAIVLLY
jgi:hypothetical protein